MLGVEPKRCEARYPGWEGYTQSQGGDATEAAPDLPPGYYFGNSPGASRRGLTACSSSAKQDASPEGEAQGRAE